MEVIKAIISFVGAALFLILMVGLSAFFVIAGSVIGAVALGILIVVIVAAGIYEHFFSKSKSDNHQLRE